MNKNSYAAWAERTFGTTMKFVSRLVACIAILGIIYVLAVVLKLGFFVLAAGLVLSIPQVREVIKYLFFK